MIKNSTGQTDDSRLDNGTTRRTQWWNKSGHGGSATSPSHAWSGSMEFWPKIRSAPSSAFVFDTLFRVGEWISPGQPVVSLLPPENVEVRFYVPQTIVGKIQQGQKAIVTYDGAEKPIDVTISYISPEAEFTPPVIYSSQSRAKLVFMLKGKSSREDATQLHPGQPIDITIPALTQ